MKKRIIAIILVLMMAVTLLPAAALAAEDGIYLSVGGKMFTAIDQTIDIGGGTAKLTWNYAMNPMLTLTNVKLTEFEDLGSSDGIHAYAGIAYSGNYNLNIVCKNCSIAAPEHGENDAYQAIYAEGNVRVTGDLSIKNMTIGVICKNTFDFAEGTLSVESIGGCAIYASAVSFGQCHAVLNTVGTNAVICDTFTSHSVNSYVYPDNSSTVINLSTDPAYGYDDVAAIICSKRAGLSHDVTINLNADYSGYTGDEPVLIAGVYAGENVELIQKAEINMNVKCSENVAVEGVVSDYVRSEGSDISFRMDLSGEHLGATAIDSMRFKSREKLHIVMKGTEAEDTGIYTEKVDDYLVMDEVYVDLDCPDAVAVCLPKDCKFVNEVMSDTLININLPKDGRMENVYDENGGFTYSTVTDTSGKPANVIVLNRLPYAFNDIGDKSTDPYRKAILWAVEQNITTGFTPIEFRPSNPCTRGQVVTFLWRANGSPEPTVTVNPFADVAETSPYYKAILWAVEQGITNGFDATHFKPSNPCTRAQVVTFLWRADGKPAPESDGNPFKDVSAVGSTKPYYEAILWAAESGITSGYSDGTFRPNATCNRGQIVTFIYRDTVERKVGKIVDATVEVNPANPSENPIRVYKDYWYSEKAVTVNVTAKYSGGDEKTLTLLMDYDNDSGTKPVSENFVEVVGYGTTQNTAIMKTNGNNGSMLVNVNFDESSAKVAAMYLPEDYVLTDRFCVYQTSDTTLFAYDMDLDVNMQLMIDVCTMCYVHDYHVSGSNVYVKENVYDGCVKIYKANLANFAYADTGRGYQSYMTLVATYDNVKSVTFDESGYTVIRTVDGEEVTTHYDFP